MSTTTTTTETRPGKVVPAGSWDVDPIHSRIGFEVEHLGISLFRGGFSGFEGQIETVDGGIESVSGTIDVDSIDVADETLAGHLRSPDFFDVENHPQGRFTSTSIEPAGEGFKVIGDLTLRGISRPVQLDAKLEGVGVGPDGSERIALSAEGIVRRGDYEMTWNADLGNGSQALAEDVRLVLTAEAVRRAR